MGNCQTATDSNAVVSLSGGKDSTAMLLMMLERNMPVDDVVFFDTGWEFPQMYEHIAKVEEYTGITVTKLKYEIPFTELMLHNHRTRGNRKDIVAGYGWPTPLARWCTTKKCQTIDRYMKKYENPKRYIGIAADEAHRCKQFNYPLVEWGVTEKDALAYCKAHGFDWDGLYDYFKRVSCFCCPLQSIDELRQLRLHHPKEWTQMLVWDCQINRPQDRPQDRFRNDYDLPELEMRFRREDRQMRLFEVVD